MKDRLLATEAVSSPDTPKSAAGKNSYQTQGLLTSHPGAQAIPGRAWVRPQLSQARPGPSSERGPHPSISKNNPVSDPSPANLT